MPLFEIRFKAELEGAKSVKMGESYSLRLKLQCGACREASDKYSVVSWEDETDVPGGKGTAHYVQKCKNCGAVANLSIVSTRGDRQFTDEDAEARKSKALATVECRGLVPLEAQAGPGWVVTGPSGESWPDVNLDEEFAEYDEKADVSITVLNAEMSIAPVKGGGK